MLFTDRSNEEATVIMTLILPLALLAGAVTGWSVTR